MLKLVYSHARHTHFTARRECARDDLRARATIAQRSKSARARRLPWRHALARYQQCGVAVARGAHGAKRERRMRARAPSAVLHQKRAREERRRATPTPERGRPARAFCANGAMAVRSLLSDVASARAVAFGIAVSGAMTERSLERGAALLGFTRPAAQREGELRDREHIAL